MCLCWQSCYLTCTVRKLAREKHSVQQMDSDMHLLGFLGSAVVRNLLAMQEHGRCKYGPWVGKIPWRSKWQRTPVFLPGQSHGERSLVVYSSWGCKESDMAERLSTHTHMHAQCSCQVLSVCHFWLYKSQNDRENRQQIWTLSLGMLLIYIYTYSCIPTLDKPL